MRTMQSQQVKGIAFGMAIILLFGPIPRAMGQQPASNSTAPSSIDAPVNSNANPTTAPLPDSPGTVHSNFLTQATSEQQPSSMKPSDQGTGSPQNSDSENASPVAGSESSSQTPGRPTDAGQPASTAADPQPSQLPHEPVGTAAAESIAVTGVAASRPAGAAVAPAKQRRVRSILIKVGALVGVGVAVGTTMALSQGSPSRPPGSH